MTYVAVAMEIMLDGIFISLSLYRFSYFMQTARRMCMPGQSK